MSETGKAEKAQKKSWFKGLKAEFKKDHLAGQENTCKADSGSCYRFRIDWAY